MTQTDMSSSNGVQVTIPAALNRPTHTLYSICMAVQPTLQEWTVNRRYSQFLQLRNDLLAALGSQSSCSSCSSFHLAIRKFKFPRKMWIRANRIVRKRVKSLQSFLKLIVERIYNDLPKCNTCGDQVKKMMRPFLSRGAQPIGESTLPKIQYSLSLQSYAPVDHRKAKELKEQRNAHPQSPVKPETPVLPSPSKTLASPENLPSPMRETNNDNEWYTSTERTDSEQFSELNSPVRSSIAFSDDSYADGYGYDEERCTDDLVPLEEAMKQVVLADGRQSTKEEVAYRLSSMWQGYDLEETLRAASELDIRLSAVDDDDSTEDHDTEDEPSPKKNGWGAVL
ncbi:hypothetical protein Poli38472_000708 [Pythium oligandrum]|uniref:PX domain-containing protein n=1 Tax=Pythium oligandrum TaxID=41045 RepID=A0A8K1CC76_PYTOL|nr:hypothetical protein Poli38472_000708 [Pythium oligandrum]|eukprot:TMW60666.1 hypothetical protein Poli38472_000708 [Pythium oligandrum]